jgi:4'-phosphopantetheinyl transferase EntD
MTVPLVTSVKEFGQVGFADKQARIFTVAEGIDAEDALEKASMMMESIMDSLEVAAMGQVKLETSHAWLALHAAESVKAIIDGLWKTLELGEGGEA